MKISRFSKFFGVIVVLETGLLLALPFIIGKNQDTNNAFLLGFGSFMTITAFLVLILFRNKIKVLTDKIPFHGRVKFIFLGWLISIFVFEFLFFFYNVLMGKNPNFLTDNLLPSTPFYIIYFSSWWYFRSRYKYSYEELFYLFGLSGFFHEQVILGYGLGAPLLFIIFGGFLNILSYGAMIAPTAYLSQNEFREDLRFPGLAQKILPVLIPSSMAFVLGLFMKNAG